MEQQQFMYMTDFDKLDVINRGEKYEKMWKMFRKLHGENLLYYFDRKAIMVKPQEYICELMDDVEKKCTPEGVSK